LCDEEDEGKGNDPCWIEDSVLRAGMVASHRAALGGKNLPTGPASVWDLARVIRTT